MYIICIIPTGFCKKIHSWWIYLMQE